ncbi:MAG: helix-turn-helix transcriptional regulator [Pontibacterium sp.]
MNNLIDRHFQAMTESAGLPLNWCQSENDSTNMLEALQHFLEDQGVADVSYSSALRVNGSDDSVLVKRKGLPHSISSTLDPKTLQAYLKGPARHDEVWCQLSETQTPVCVNHSRSRSLKQDRAAIFWSYLNVSGRVIVPIASRHDDYWFKFFVLYLKTPEQDSQAWFSERKQWLLPLLNRVSHVLSFDQTVEANPYLKLDVLSDTCRRIMLFTSQGDSVKQVAEKVGLSQEGVTYHITRVKRLFGAKNKTQLIAALCHSQVI